MPVTKRDGTVVLALIRGDDQLEEAKLAAALQADVRPSTEDEIRQAFGADPGSIGPVGFPGEIVADETLREGQFVAGANRTGFHLRGVEHGRDFEARFADLRRPLEGDGCPRCGGALRFQTAIEVGHIFKLETRFSEPLGATFLDEDGKERALVMGSYGIGPGRVLAAAVEQRHDENGIVWPAALAPYDAEVISLDAGSDEIAATRHRSSGRAGGGGPLGAAGRPRPTPGGEVRRCRPVRLPCQNNRGSQDPRRRRGGRARANGWQRRARADY